MDIRLNILKKITNLFFQVLKKINLPVELITIFRILFGFLTAGVLLLEDYIISIIFITIYQFVLLLDSIDGDLARHQKRFSKKWAKADFLFHYIISATFLLSISLTFINNVSFNYILALGLISSISLIISGIIGLTNYKRIVTEGEDYKGSLRKIYPYIALENPFNLFFLFILIDLKLIALVFYTILSGIIFIRKIKLLFNSK
jgi:phosphatidylglycerophosphate synthase